jgi:hypothetical protein
MTNDQGATGWHKSSYSDSTGGACIEQGVSVDGAHAVVRDTKNDGVGAVLGFHPDAWVKFVKSVR